MLYYLSQYLMDQATGTAWESEVSALRLFRYITFRSAGAAVTALLLSLWFGPKMIAWLKELSFGQNYRDRAEVAGNLTGREPKKFGTPTMGGLLIVLTLNLTTLLWAEWNTLVALTVVSVAVLAALGFYDDYTKITKASSAGAKSHIKVYVQTALGLFIGIYLWWSPAT
jgi:phospho-N-acetylmuramoyl-pentapeptide-transferase